MRSRAARRRRSRSPTTSRPCSSSRRATARYQRAARSGSRKSQSIESVQGGSSIMMQAGIFTGYFPYGLEETATKIRGLGFNTVQLDLHFKDVDLSAGQITRDKARKVRDVFRDHNLPICCVSGYINIIHPHNGQPNK